MPPTPRKKKRAKEDRGLPDDKVIAELAREYVTWQHNLWPKLAAAGLLPTSCNEDIQKMVDDYKHRHRGGKINLEGLAPFLALKLEIWGDYGRYSANNSKLTSISDQLVNVLKKAAAEGRFIPWTLVYSDYSISGLLASRVGYTSYKAVLKNKDLPLTGTYIDDFTRASRDEIEWWRLARLSRRLNKKMLGASDGFDLHHPTWDLQISLFAILSRLFIKALREKVRRGMQGAGRRFTCLGRPGLGFTRCLQRDQNGNVVRDSEGNPIHSIAQHPETAVIRRQASELFALKNMSPGKITRMLNEQKAGGWDGWTESGVRDMLKNPSSIGVFISNRYRTEIVDEDDGDEPRKVQVENPRNEWVVVYIPSLAIIDLNLWRLMRRKFAARRRKRTDTKDKPSRNQNYATTLLSGTLFCSYCGSELKLGRSGKYKTMCCFNGALAVRGCKLTSHKSTRIIEKAILKTLMEGILSKEALLKLVQEGNEFLNDVKSKPPAEVKPLKTRLKNLQLKIDRMVLDNENEPDEQTRMAFRKRIRELTQQAKEKTDEIRKVQPIDTAKLKLLDSNLIWSYVQDPRTVLNQEIPVAAEAIRALTGPIKISQRPKPNSKHGAIWVAHFQPNFVNFLRHCLKDKNYPDSYTLEFLCGSIWTISETVEVTIDFVPKYEEFAAKVLADHQAGVPQVNTCRKYKLNNVEYADALRFAQTGERPQPKKAPTKQNRNRENQGKGRPNKYQAHIPEVLRFKDVENLPFDEIARRLNVSIYVVYRCYEEGHPEIVQQAISENRAIAGIPKHARLRPEQKARLETMILANKLVHEIAVAVGCSVQTVYRAKARMKRDKR